jgi:hypothetical protein
MRGLTLVDAHGQRIVEGAPDEPLMLRAQDATLLLEACFSHRTSVALLYARNLTDRFFDVSSGDAGELLQKLRNYGLRLAVVCPPGSARFSSRFGELLADERRHDYFNVFTSRDEARAWLASGDPSLSASRSSPP